MKINNFSAGPSKIPQIVLGQIAKDITDYQDLGYSVLELSHRSTIFEKILTQTKAKLIQILDIPANFEIIFLQGGATFQNTFIPANKPSLLDNISFLISGTWGKKTHEDFQKYYGKKIEKFDIPNVNLGMSHLISVVKRNQSEYIYLTSNETIEGIQIKDFNEVAHSNLLVDMSSDLGSYPFSFDKVSYIYAGAQKNMGIPGVTICLVNKDFLIDVDNSSYLNLKKLTTSNSVLNTPPTFSIFVLNLVTEWMIKSGGLDYFEKKSISQSNELYKFLDENSNLFDFSSELRFRSKSNVVFKFKEDKYNDAFIKQANDSGIIGINGHRSVGGIRVSLFNSVDQPMFNYFMDFLKKFINESL